MELLETLFGPVVWVLDKAWPLLETVGPWLIAHPPVLTALGFVYVVLAGVGSMLKAKPGMARELGLPTGIKVAAIVVTVIYVARNWPTVMAIVRRFVLAVIVAAWALLLYLRPDLRWGLGVCTAFVAAIYAVLRWAEWTDGAWFSRDAYHAALKRDLRVKAAAHALRTQYPGSDPVVRPGTHQGRRGYAVDLNPGYGQSVAGLAEDAQGGSIGASLARSGRRYGLHEPPQGVRVMRGRHQGDARLWVDTDEPVGLDEEIPWPGYAN